MEMLGRITTYVKSNGLSRVLLKVRSYNDLGDLCCILPINRRVVIICRRLNFE